MTFVLNNAFVAIPVILLVLFAVLGDPDHARVRARGGLPARPLLEGQGARG